MIFINKTEKANHFFLMALSKKEKHYLVIRIFKLALKNSTQTENQGFK